MRSATAGVRRLHGFRVEIVDTESKLESFLPAVDHAIGEGLATPPKEEARWVPWGPHLVNSAAGVYGISLTRHGGCVALGIAPQALFVSALGKGLLSL